MERLDESYPTVYQLHWSDERIEKNYAKTSAVHKRAAPPFSKFLQNRAESRKVFNMSKMLLLHTHPTVYHTHHLDKRLKSLNLYEIRKPKTELLHFFWLEISLKPWGIRESVLHMDWAPDRYLSTVYYMHHSDKRLKRNHENTPAVKVGHRTVFETALKPRGIRGSVQHTKMLHFNTNPMVYHTLNYDERLKSWRENGTCGSVLPELQCSELSIAVLCWDTMRFGIMPGCIYSYIHPSYSATGFWISYLGTLS